MKPESHEIKNDVWYDVPGDGSAPRQSYLQQPHSDLTEQCEHVGEMRAASLTLLAIAAFALAATAVLVWSFLP